jgi:CubicO group peptidase (beta-lactamase class C family)
MPASAQVRHALERLVEGAPERGPTGAALAVGAADGSMEGLVVGCRQHVAGTGRNVAEPPPVTPDTRFDVGSVTKVMVTTAAAMTMVARDELDLDARAAVWLPDFTGDGKDTVTVRQLLTHRAGLWEWWPLYVQERERHGALAAVQELPLRYPVGAGRHYSDLSFMLLGAILEEISYDPLDALAARLVCEPLELTASGYQRRWSPGPDGPVAATSLGDAWERRMIATGEPYPVGEDADEFDGWRAHVLCGEVADGNAFHAFHGVAGHAGLFTTATDMAKFGQALLGDFWPRAVVEEFTTDGPDPGQALGWRTRTLGGVRLVGHPGFPGARIEIAPDRGVAVALVSNRLHPQSTPVSIDAEWDEILAAVLAGETRRTA